MLFYSEEEGVTLIDSCKMEHSIILEEALHKLGKSPSDVRLVLATHGHEDHIQGSTIFKNAKKFIHPNEENSMEIADPTHFKYQLSDHEIRKDFECILVGYHTPGSVAFYHRSSKVLFTGDFLCFFCDPLSKDGLESEGNELRSEWIEYLRNGGVKKENLNVFLSGLNGFNSIDPSAMCTGHGGVLVGNIKDFVTDLIEVGNNYKQNI
ncbi:MBL fold metallo-hydrolase [Bacillus sp. EAC]|uniref:MBL fold metallo-hydrolase n=1 Tax=Bacillus sp. EAC TaxID=1978338 RepID=UPI0011551BDA|nr:MBL fold metallo-hydrolase [Bacillus sp. EAC]